MKEAPTRLYAGFDGGGTRTTCVVCDPTGSVLGVGSGGRSNYHNTGQRNAVASLRRSFEGALAESGVGGGPPSVEACFGLAGLDSAVDFAIMKSAIRSMELGSGRKRTELVVNDWRTAVTGAFIDEPGVTLIAGTGCVAAAQSPGGRRVVRVGGWGHIVDDRGSSYDIGRDALYAAMRDHDGRGPKTALLKLIMRRLDVGEPQGIIAKVYAGHITVSEIASLSVLVSEAAEGGDGVALEILREKGDVLGELVVSAASRLGMLKTPFGVSLNGGVFSAGRPILEPLEERIRAAAPRAEIVERKLAPACGAVVLLFRKAGVKVDRKMVARMALSFKKVSAKR
ncbi:MAG TPA: BadF/BadG/BcrA/BcrD ATPase family protein [Nitrososphaerales archaeon]|nr:BadF/BadG/BcrA/BcrD ATPase family protein [Nitrososphaerales archaeon]